MEQKQITLEIYNNTRPQMVRDMCLSYAHKHDKNGGVFSCLRVNKNLFVVQSNHTTFNFNLVRGNKHNINFPVYH